MWKKLFCSCFGHKQPYLNTPWYVRCRRCKAVIRRKTTGEYLKENGKL